MKFKAFVCCATMLFLTACVYPIDPYNPVDPVDPDPVCPTDPLPLPPEMETNKDRSIDPGDSFYDYCNGNWLRNTPHSCHWSRRGDV